MGEILLDFLRDTYASEVFLAELVFELHPVEEFYNPEDGDRFEVMCECFAVQVAVQGALVRAVNEVS